MRGHFSRIAMLIPLLCFVAIGIARATPSFHGVFAEVKTRYNLMTLSETQQNVLIDDLKARKVALHLAIREEDFHNAKYWSFIQRLHSAGITVNPWPLLTTSEGYWAFPALSFPISPDNRELISGQ